MTRRSISYWLEKGLFLLGVVLLGVWIKSHGDALAFQSRESARLDAAVRAKQTVDAASPQTVKRSQQSRNRSVASRAAAAPPRGRQVLGRLEIPRLGIAAVIAEGTDREMLECALGHVTSTALPGRAGNCAIAGHRDTFLRGLGEIRNNDVVQIVTVSGTYRYRVQWSGVVGPERTDVLDPTAASTVTLITCYPFHLVGPAPDRFTVRATLDHAPGASHSTS